MKSICVYCGSSPGASETYASGARDLAKIFAEQQISLVYGGGSVGLMGILADEVMRLGGHVTGVIPLALMNKELGHTQLSTLHVVKNMHERKAMMSELSDGFIALPGGIGTLEEIFEMFTWLQLGIHSKPLGLLNIDGFYDKLILFLEHVVKNKFLESQHLNLLINEAEPELLIQGLSNFHPSRTNKCLKPEDS